MLIKKSTALNKGLLVLNNRQVSYLYKITSMCFYQMQALHHQ